MTFDSISARYSQAFITTLTGLGMEGRHHEELHPDGQAALTWRKPDFGILNIAFNGIEGIATWGAYFEEEGSSKGRFNFPGNIPLDILDMIKLFEEQGDDNR